MKLFDFFFYRSKQLTDYIYTDITGWTVVQALC